MPLPPRTPGYSRRAVAYASHAAPCLSGAIATLPLLP